MSGYYGTIRNTETDERVEINYTDGFNVYWDSPYMSSYFKDCGDGRLYEYGPDDTLGNVRWEWIIGKGRNEA